MNVEKLDAALLGEIEAHAIDIAHKAGQILLEHFSQPLEVQFKDKKKTDPVTTADHRSEEYLKRAIGEKFPEHGILSEEEKEPGKSVSPFVWVIDPLDGTANFMNGLPLFAVSIGVLWKRQPVAGSIYVPVSHRAVAGVYHACLGKGSFFNDERIAVATTLLGHPLVEVPAQLGNRFRLSGRSRKEPHEARNLGSIALELALAACGVFQYALFGGPKLWDVAAGVLLVKEAGGLAFVRRKGNWSPLERFQLEQGNEDETLQALRKWSSPLIVGAPGSARKVVQDLRIRHNYLSWLRARRWLRRQKGRKQSDR